MAPGLPKVRITSLLALLLMVVVMLGVFQSSMKVGRLRAIPPPPTPTETRVRQMGINVQFTTRNIDNDDDRAFLERLNRGDLDQDDKDLAIFIRKYYVVLPSDEPYNMKTKEDTSMGQSVAINKILKNQTDGFFVECGALDGETRSNTYFFERQMGWSGLLIEGDPSNFKLLVPKHRKAYSINACLSLTDKPSKAVYEQSFNVGKIVAGAKADGKKRRITVQCFPLLSILAAMEVTRVDYFSLDVEGAEMEVLRAIPFDRLDIRTMSVEYNHDQEGETGVQTFVEGKSYIAHSKVTHEGNWANDIIFVKNGTTNN